MQRNSVKATKDGPDYMFYRQGNATSVRTTGCYEHPGTYKPHLRCHVLLVISHQHTTQSNKLNEKFTDLKRNPNPKSA